jgi:transcription elongation factor GreA
MDQEKEYLTQEKFNELTAELADLKTRQRREIAERLEFAKSLGDLSENAEYHAARDEQSEVEDRINQLETLLKNCEIVSHHQHHLVEVGATVILKKEGENDSRRYTLVGSAEADSGAGKISHHSPIGNALLGRKKGETVEVQTPRGASHYRILSIE